MLWEYNPHLEHHWWTVYNLIWDDYSSVFRGDGHPCVIIFLFGHHNERGWFNQSGPMYGSKSMKCIKMRHNIYIYTWTQERLPKYIRAMVRFKVRPCDHKYAPFLKVRPWLSIMIWYLIYGFYILSSLPTPQLHGPTFPWSWRSWNRAGLRLTRAQGDLKSGHLMLLELRLNTLNKNPVEVDGLSNQSPLVRIWR